jgi:hypothetical protein
MHNILVKFDNFHSNSFQDSKGLNNASEVHNKQINAYVGAVVEIL